MKKLTLIWVAITLFAMVSHAQTTAVDFTKTDCDGNSRSLFQMIDSGNVVILVYEHQCGSCFVGANNLKTAINTYFASAKNIRVMYLDNGGFSCSSVKTWVTSHSLISGPAFSYSADGSSPYGSGMPVIVITGGKTHKVYSITNSVNLPNVSTLKTAIQAALTDISNGINTGSGMAGLINIYPNPAVNDKVCINFSNTQSQVFSYEIFNAAGQTVLPSISIKTGDQQAEISITGYENGIYFIYLNSAEGRIAKKLIISR